MKVKTAEGVKVLVLEEGETMYAVVSPHGVHGLCNVLDAPTDEYGNEGGARGWARRMARRYGRCEIRSAETKALIETWFDNGQCEVATAPSPNNA